MELDWSDAEEIGLQLMERHADVDPLTIRFTDLHKWVMEIPGFIGKPEKSNEKILEAIQMAWHEERQDAKDSDR
jgi:FeS assembly protein IscX